MRFSGIAPLDEHDLEHELLRKSVRALTAGRERCADCDRTPLVGERVYRYHGGVHVCELCRPLRREEPLDRALVRSSEHGHAVRISVRAA